MLLTNRTGQNVSGLWPLILIFCIIHVLLSLFVKIQLNTLIMQYIPCYFILIISNISEIMARSEMKHVGDNIK
jgi:hypothetical protein